MKRLWILTLLTVFLLSCGQPEYVSGTKHGFVFNGSDGAMRVTNNNSEKLYVRGTYIWKAEVTQFMKLLDSGESYIWNRPVILHRASHYGIYISDKNQQLLYYFRLSELDKEK